MAALSVIANPTKFANLDRSRDALDRELRKLGETDYELVLTTAEDTGAGQALAAVKSGADLVISWGGDGTIRAVAEGLLGSNVPLGILPGGTGNLVAKNLKLPGTWQAALAVAIGQRTQAIDVNEVDLGDGVQRISLLICGMGLDAAVIDSPEELKAVLGSAAYAAMAAKNVLGKAKPIAISVNDGSPIHVTARMALVGNFGRMQMGLDPFQNASATDGELAVFVAKLRGVRELLLTGHGTLRRLDAKGKHRIQLSGQTVELRTTEPWPREIDGDLVEPGDYMAVKVLPKAINVRVR